MPRRIKGPDGIVRVFPDDATDDEIRAALGGTSVQAPATPGETRPPELGTAMAAEVGTQAKDFLVGAGKKAVESVNWIADHTVRKIPGADVLDRMAPPIQVDTTPTNAMQRAGGTAEQIAEVLLPAGRIAKLGTKAAEVAAPALSRFVGQTAAQVAPRAAVEATAGAGLSAMQGGDATTGAALSAAMPVAGRFANSLAPKLQEAARKQVVQALGPTKERFKAMAERLAPEMLRRGIRGSRESVLAHAAEAAEVAGEQIEAAIEQYGGRQVGTDAVVKALETAKDAFRTFKRMAPDEAVRRGLVENADGAFKMRNGARLSDDGMVEVPVVFEARAIRQLDGLQKIIGELGPEARVDQLIAVRRAWDRVVDQAGGFAHRAGGAVGMPLKDSSEAWAKREATSAIRKLLNDEVPELTALNKEYSFWKSLEDVLAQTLKRTQPQGPGLTREVAGAAAAAAGSGSGVGTAVALQKVGKMAHSVFTSPRWRLASAQAKDALAEAIASGRVSNIATALSRIGAVQVSKVPLGATGGW